MKIIGLEEHFVIPEVLHAWQALDPRWQDLAIKPSSEGDGGRRLLALGPERIAAMDEEGIDVQVLSCTAPGVQSLAADSRWNWRSCPMIVWLRWFVPGPVAFRLLPLCRLLRHTLRHGSWSVRCTNSAYRERWSLAAPVIVTSTIRISGRSLRRRRLSKLHCHGSLYYQ